MRERLRSVADGKILSPSRRSLLPFFLFLSLSLFFLSPSFFLSIFFSRAISIPLARARAIITKCQRIGADRRFSTSARLNNALLPGREEFSPVANLVTRSLNLIFKAHRVAYLALLSARIAPLFKQPTHRSALIY